MRKWQLQEAKARLSDLVKKATTEGPQQITVHGELAAVVMSPSEFEKLSKKPAKKKKLTFLEFMRVSPLYGVELDLTRDNSLCRDEKIFDED